MLKEWALATFPKAMDYWVFRKNFTIQLALLCFCEYVFHLTRLNADSLYLHQDSGFVHCGYFKFDIDDHAGDFNSNQPVPFRLTPNISEFVTQLGVGGPFTACMIAVARCFVYPQYKMASYLSAILSDELTTWLKKKQDILTTDPDACEINKELLIQSTQKAVQTIMDRLQLLSVLDGADSKVKTLVTSALSPDNLCRMDPAWHPWL